LPAALSQAFGRQPIRSSGAMLSIVKFFMVLQKPRVGGAAAGRKKEKRPAQR
jgi:hypothetical protein